MTSVQFELWHRSNCTLVTNFSPPEAVIPFGLADEQVKRKYAACLVDETLDIEREIFIFRHGAFVSAPSPIPFLFRLQTELNIALGIYLDEGNKTVVSFVEMNFEFAGSYLTVTQRTGKFPLIVHSHCWLEYKPLNKDGQKSNWPPLIGITLENISAPSFKICFPYKYQSDMGTWRWNSNMNPDSVWIRHELLRHHFPTIFMDLYNR